jgi:hypothetical protein
MDMRFDSPFTETALEMMSAWLEAVLPVIAGNGGIIARDTPFARVGASCANNT